MLTEFRVTKYDPQMRLPGGRYSVAEWTSASDIGRTFLGRTFDVHQYVLVEDSYIEAIHRFMKASGVSSLQVEDLEIHANRGTIEIPLRPAAKPTQIRNRTSVCGPDLDLVARLALREAIWCRLEGPDGVFVHFGNDYCMYIGTKKDSPIPEMPRGIFVESFTSPYHRQPDEEEG